MMDLIFSELKNKVEVILISKQDQDALVAFELGLVDCLPSNFRKSAYN